MNESDTIHLKDDKFSSLTSQEMQLLIKLGHERISYAIFSKRDNRLVELYDSGITGSAHDTLNSLFEENDHLRSTFSDVKVSVQTFNFTFIPAQYYTRDNMQGYEKLIQASEDTKTFVSSINGDTIKCITALDLARIKPLVDTFPDAKLLSQAEPLIEAGLKGKETAGQRLILEFGRNLFEACFIVDDKFAFYNIFRFENADEFNYYLVMLMNQLSIDGQNASVLLSGETSTEQDTFERVCKYFTNIRFADDSALITSSIPFDRVPKHRFFSLTSMLLCE